MMFIAAGMWVSGTAAANASARMLAPFWSRRASF
jgi:hypothetical protein